MTPVPEVSRVIRTGSPAFMNSIPKWLVPALLLLSVAGSASAYTVRKDMSEIFYSMNTPAVTETTIHHQVFFDDLEGSVAGWSTLDWRAGEGVNWNIVSGTHSCTGSAWWCGKTNIVPGRDGYGNSWIQLLTTNVPINIAGLNTARLTFKHRLQTEFDFDTAWILIKGGNVGARWDTLASYSGNLGTSCNNATIDIPDSFKAVTQPVTLQFLFGSDMNTSAQDSSGAYTGWSIDDVKIAGTGGQGNDVRFFDDMTSGSGKWTAVSPDPGPLWHIASAPDPFSTCFFMSTNVFVPYAGDGLVPDWVDAMLISPPMDLQGVFSPNAGATLIRLQFDDWINLASENCVFWSLWISGSNDKTTWTPWMNFLGSGHIISGGTQGQCIESVGGNANNNLNINPYNTVTTGVAPNTRYIRLGFRLRSEKATTNTETDAGPLRIGVLSDGIWFDNIRVTTVYTITGIEPVSAVPVAPKPSLVKAYPNPFNPRTTLEFSVPEAGPVSVRIFDTHGKMVATLVNESMSPGVYRTRWDGKDRSGADAASGLYFAQIQGRAGRDTKRLTLLK